MDVRCGQFLTFSNFVITSTNRKWVGKSKKRQQNRHVDTLRVCARGLVKIDRLLLSENEPMMRLTHWTSNFPKRGSYWALRNTKMGKNGLDQKRRNISCMRWSLRSRHHVASTSECPYHMGICSNLWALLIYLKVFMSINLYRSESIPGINYNSKSIAQASGSFKLYFRPVSASFYEDAPIAQSSSLNWRAKNS